MKNTSNLRKFVKKRTKTAQSFNKNLAHSQLLVINQNLEKNSQIIDLDNTILQYLAEFAKSQTKVLLAVFLMLSAIIASLSAGSSILSAIIGIYQRVPRF